MGRKVKPQPTPSRAPGPLLRVGAPLLLVLATVAVVVLGTRRSAPPPAAPRAPAARPNSPGPPPRATEVPLRAVERVVSVDAQTACATGGPALACTLDGGVSWQPFGELPDRALSAARSGGELLAACAAGVFAIAPGAEPRLVVEPPAGATVVDAASRDGALWLLAHAYSEPADELVLPTVTETSLWVLAPGARLERRGAIRGFGGDGLVVHKSGEVATFAAWDPRAYRSRDGGRTFKRVGRDERVAADYGGLLAALERGVERLPDRQARPVTTLFLSRDGGATWDVGFHAPGDLLVDFADARRGALIAREEAIAYRTRDGGGSFELLHRDERLTSVVDVAPLDGRWVAVTREGDAIDLGAR